MLDYMRCNVFQCGNTTGYQTDDGGRVFIQLMLQKVDKLCTRGDRSSQTMRAAVVYEDVTGAVELCRGRALHSAADVLQHEQRWGASVDD